MINLSSNQSYYLRLKHSFCIVIPPELPFLIIVCIVNTFYKMTSRLVVTVAIVLTNDIYKMLS